MSYVIKLRGPVDQWRSTSPRVQRINKRQLYRRAIELNADEPLLESSSLKSALAAEGIDYFISRDVGALSNYYVRGPVADPIYVTNESLGQAQRIDAYSKLYTRYAQPARLTRLYCRPDQLDRARACLRAFFPRQFELNLG